MNILLIHQAFASPNEPGGTRHYELAHHLVRAGHRFTILASRVHYLTGLPSKTPGNATGEEPEPGISILRCYSTETLHKSFAHRTVAYCIFALVSFITGLRVTGVDLVWGTSPPIFQAVAALLIARLKRVPFLLEVRDLWPTFAIELGVLRNPLLIASSRWLERVLYRHADQIVVNSPGFLAHLLERGVPTSRVVVIPNGVETGLFDPTDRGLGWRHRFGLDGRFIVLYTGAHGVANDLETILHAAARLRDESAICFVLVGDGKEKSNLVRLAREMGLDNVVFLPAQPKVSIPEALAASDVCVATLRALTGFETTYPNKIFDYMAAGRPIVLAIAGVACQLVQRGECGICVPPGNPDALATAVRKLSHDPELRSRLGSNGRRFVTQFFSRERQAQELAALLQRLVRKGQLAKPCYSGKRVLDLVLAIPAFLFSLPVAGLIAALIYVVLGPPVLFRQQRPGLHAVPFTLLKFRTMTEARDESGQLLPDEKRLTALGRFLRSTSLDELPQLLNVLRGDMSLVGPRPLLMEYLDRYTPEQMRRHEVKPGITGWAQVKGRNALTWEERLALDVWYVDHRSFWLDVWILLLTVWTVIRREGISHPGEATMPEFRGLVKQ